MKATPDVADGFLVDFGLATDVGRYLHARMFGRHQYFICWGQSDDGAEGRLVERRPSSRNSNKSTPDPLYASWVALAAVF